MLTIIYGDVENSIYNTNVYIKKNTFEDYQNPQNTVLKE